MSRSVGVSALRTKQTIGEPINHKVRTLTICAITYVGAQRSLAIKTGEGEWGKCQVESQ